MGASTGSIASGTGDFGSNQEFEDYVMAPISPFTPYPKPGASAPAQKTKLAFASEPKGDKKKSSIVSSSNSKRASSAELDDDADSAAKRGEYKCGKCGFFPKKTKHDCAAYKAKCIAQGIEINMR